jgi:hypothetical protein
MADTNLISQDAMTKISWNMGQPALANHMKVLYFLAISIYNKDLTGVKNVMLACVLLHYANLPRTVSWHGKPIVSWQPCE